MNLWHIQLHPTDAKDWSPEKTLSLVEQGLIGCSGKSVIEFQKLRPGDVVLVRYGKNVVALVENRTIPHPTDPHLRSPLIWFDWCSKIKILKSYDREVIGGKGWYLPTTIQRIKNPTALEYIQTLLAAI